MSMFYYFFKTLVGKEVVVELKNNLAIRGKLHSVDQVCMCVLARICIALISCCNPHTALEQRCSPLNATMLD